MEILKPIEPMLAEYAAGEDVFSEIINLHTGVTYPEMKYDGYRLQLHKKGNILKAFTRNLNEAPLEIYQELESSIRNLPDCVIDCELNGGIGHQGFKNVQKRFRLKMPDMKKYKTEVDVKKKLELMVFDTLYFEGKWLLDTPLNLRRTYTEKFNELRIKPSKRWAVSNHEKFENLFEQLIKERNEGLVCKAGYSLYVPGYRGNNWLKLKRFETLDLLLLGVYLENNEISQFLCGSYNDKTKCFETLGKVNAKREGIGKIVYEKLKNKLKKEKPNDILLSPKMKAAEMPQLYLNPKDSIILEIKAMNILKGKNQYSCGLEDGKSYSLRIGWVKCLREDKSSLDATTTKKVAEMYKMQEK